LAVRQDVLQRFSDYYATSASTRQRDRTAEPKLLPLVASLLLDNQ
jgi:hypothetical protein